MRRILAWLKRYFGWNHPPLTALPPENLRDSLRYHNWAQRPEVDSECGRAHPMFLLRSYGGKKEQLSVDTEARSVNYYVLVREFGGKPERLDDLDIRPKS
jgi:hypothetical protein